MIGNRGGGLGRIDDGGSMIISCAKKIKAKRSDLAPPPVQLGSRRV